MIRVTRKRRREVNKILEGHKEIFDDLTLLDDGNYVLVDDRLLKKLKAVEPEDDNTVNPFQDHPDYMRFIRETTSISSDFLKTCQNKSNNDQATCTMKELAGTVPIEILALRRSNMQEDDYEYKYKMTVEPRVTDQYQTGRCWMFASLNVLRYGIISKFDLEPKFEFSTAYLFFWDKFERSNTFLDMIWQQKDKDLQDRYLEVFTNPGYHHLSDGGYWQYFKNLADKYGLVPKSVYTESVNCYSSDTMNDLLVKYLNQAVLSIRDIETREEFEQAKAGYLETVYDILVRCMGNPPTKFDWRYKDRVGTYHEVKNLTPQKFYQIIVPDDLDTKITIIHDPRHPENYYKSHYLEYGYTVAGGEPFQCINMPLEDIKDAISESIIDENPVWFACDVGADMDFATSTMDTERFNYQPILGIPGRYSKTDMMKMKTSIPSHAMVIAGVDMDEKKEDVEPVYRKWRIENSWGTQVDLDWHPDYGYYKASDKWFDQYFYMAVVDIKYFKQDVLRKILDNQKETVVISPFDIFGTVAMHQGCSKCKQVKH